MMPNSPIDDNQSIPTRRRLPESLRINALSIVGRSPRAYEFIARRFGGRAGSLVDSTTDLCIEAPPGSGNSFIVQAFALANPSTKVAHHHHVSSQVATALRMGIPSLVILRNPIDCVLARVREMNELDLIGPNFRMWWAFWRDMESLMGRVVLMTFEDLVSEPDKAIELVNHKFGKAFNSVLPTSEEVFDVMRLHRRESVLPDVEKSLDPNVPDSNKANAKRLMKPHVVAHRLARITEEFYQRILPTAQGR
jgi:hypothetical protein